MFGLTETEILARKEILASFPEVEEAVIYGSRARGTNRRSSDIDMTLKGDDLTYLQLALIDARIDELLMPYFVDLSLYRLLNDLDLLESINREGKIFYSRNNN